jgi:hypothetical protein
VWFGLKVVGFWLISLRIIFFETFSSPNPHALGQIPLCCEQERREKMDVTYNALTNLHHNNSPIYMPGTPG